MSDNGALIELKTDKQGRLKIPTNCKSLERGSLVPAGDICVIEIGENVEYVEDKVFDYRDDWKTYEQSQYLHTSGHYACVQGNYIFVPFVRKEIHFRFNNVKPEVAKELINQAYRKVSISKISIDSITGEYIELVTIGICLGYMSYVKSRCFFKNYLLNNLIKAEDISEIEATYRKLKNIPNKPLKEKHMLKFMKWANVKFGCGV